MSERERERESIWNYRVKRRKDDCTNNDDMRLRYRVVKYKIISNTKKEKKKAAAAKYLNC